MRNLVKAHDELLRANGRLPFDARFRQLRVFLDRFVAHVLAIELSGDFEGLT